VCTDETHRAVLPDKALSERDDRLVVDLVAKLVDVSEGLENAVGIPAEDLAVVVDVLGRGAVHAVAPGRPNRPHGARLPDESGPASRVELRAADDLTEVVDAQGSARVAAEGAQVGHRPTIPQDRVPDGVAVGSHQLRITNHLPGLVDVHCLAGVAAERAEIGHDAVLPLERMGDVVAVWVEFGGLRSSDNLAGIVQAVGPAAGAAEGAEIGHDAIVPVEGVRGPSAVLLDSGDVANVVDGA